MISDVILMAIVSDLTFLFVTDVALTYISASDKMCAQLSHSGSLILRKTDLRKYLPDQFFWTHCFMNISVMRNEILV